jgi:hypothetical protein
MATTEAPSAEPAATNPCPKCAKPLTDAAGLGWCPACGYCRALAETAGKTDPAKPASSPEVDVTPATLAAAAARLPLWVAPLAVGMGLFVVVSLYIGKLLPPNSFERALWTTLQIMVGLGVLFAGQFIALIYIAPQDEKLGFKDAIFPFRLYGLVFQRLPQLRLSVWCLGWGVSIIVSAFVFIGGLGHWFTYLKNNKDKAANATSNKR